MWQTKCVYYSDSTLQLDLNLKNIQRELNGMLEYFEGQHCLTCYRLKCACAEAAPGRSADSDSKVKYAEIEAWMKASKLRELSETEKKVQQVKDHLVNNKSCSPAAVDAFFRAFKMPPNASVTYLSNKLAEAYTRVNQRADYSYF